MAPSLHFLAVNHVRLDADAPSVPQDATPGSGFVPGRKRPKWVIRGMVGPQSLATGIFIAGIQLPRTIRANTNRIGRVRKTLKSFLSVNYEANP